MHNITILPSHVRDNREWLGDVAGTEVKMGTLIGEGLPNATDSTSAALTHLVVWP